jgi:type II secretory pathway pseudopilin PulG
MGERTVQLRAFDQRPVRRIAPVRAFSVRGFTLVELMCVAVIAITLAAIAIPRFGSSAARRRADAAASRVAADLAFVLGNARAASIGRSIVFSELTGRYEAASMSNPITNASAPYRVTLGDDPYRVSLLRAEFGDDTTLDVDGYGKPLETGWVVVGVGRNYRKVSLNESGSTSITSLTRAQVAELLGVSDATLDDAVAIEVGPG